MPSASTPPTGRTILLYTKTSASLRTTPQNFRGVLDIANSTEQQDAPTKLLQLEACQVHSTPPILKTHIARKTNKKISAN